MLAASAAFDLAIDSLSRTVAGEFTIDLPDLPGVTLVSNYTQALASISLSAQNGTDLPANVRDVSGYTSISGEAVLAGPIGPLRKETVAWLFNPDNPASPLYRVKIKGSPVTFSFGVAVRGSTTPELIRKFTGSVDTYSYDPAAGTVTFQLLDVAGSWVDTPAIPAVVTSAPYNAGLTSEFAMDQIVRAVSGRGSSWPATRPLCVWAAGMRSSTWPEVGQLSLITGPQPLPAFAPSAYGSGLVGNGTIHGGTLDQPLASDVYFGALIGGTDPALGGPEVTLGALGGLTLAIGSGNVIVQAGNVTVATVALAAGNRHVEMHANLPAVGGVHYTGTVWIDGGATTFTGDSDLSRPSTPWQYIGIATHPTVSISGTQATLETAPTPDAPWTPAAILDTSLNPLTVCPEVAEGTTASDELQVIAAAELGYARTDEYGVFRFTNRHTIAAQPVARTITADRSLKNGLTTTVGGGTEYHKVQVPFTEWSLSAPTAVFTLAAIKRIPRNTTITWTQELDTLVANLDKTAAPLPDGHATADGGTWYRASTDLYGTTRHAGLTITIAQPSAGTIQISAKNSTTQDAYLVTSADFTDLTAGQAGTGLWVGGRPVTPADEAIAEASYSDGKPVLTVASNAYIQFQDIAEQLARDVKHQVVTALRDFESTPIVPDSRIQITDPVHVIDTYRSLIDEFCSVWGWSFDADFPVAGESGGSWEMALNLRASAPPGGWIVGVPGRGEIGTTAWAYA